FTTGTRAGVEDTAIRFRIPALGIQGSAIRNRENVNLVHLIRLIGTSRATRTGDSRRSLPLVRLESNTVSRLQMLSKEDKRRHTADWRYTMVSRWSAMAMRDITELRGQL